MDENIENYITSLQDNYRFISPKNIETLFLSVPAPNGFFLADILDFLSKEELYERYIKKLSSDIVKTKFIRKKAVLLVGSGISFPAKIPSLSDIFKHFIETSLATSEFKESYNQLTSKKSNERTIKELYPQFRETRAWDSTRKWLWDSILEAKPTESHKTITKLCDMGYVDYIFSLNYDDLFEKEDKDLKIYDVILTPDALRNRLEDPIRQGTPLIKAHGDIFTLNCPKCHYSSSLPKIISSENEPLNKYKKCPRDRSLLELPMRLPDSAREGSEKYISYLDKLAERRDIGILVCIGFSGNYDVHIVDMIKKFESYKTIIYNIDPDPSGLVSVLPPDCHLKIDADKIFGNVIKEISKCKINIGLELDFVDGFFDPIYKLVRITRIEQEICYSPIFRRLQGIHQLGIKYCKFIGANHNRFEHSICVMQQADSMYLNLKRINHHNEDARNFLDPHRNKIERQFLRLGALLHDIGHLSFGHLTEEILTEVTGTEHHHDLDLAEHILDMLRESIRPNDSMDDPLPIEGNYYYTWTDLFNLIIGRSGINILDKLIKSTFDADKIEYLTRDSIMTGANYGNKLDISILLDNLLITENESLVVGEEAISVLEAISEARYHMNVEVYYNIDVRCYETLLKKLLKEWISEKKISRDVKSLEENLFRNDQWILNELDDYYEKSDHLINRKLVDIVKGVAPLPKRIMVELVSDYFEKDTNNGKKREDISGEEKVKILSDIKRVLELSRDLVGFVLCDTYDFTPYKQAEEPSILIRQYDIHNRTVSLREEKLSECSRFIELLSGLSRSLEYKIRIYILQDKDEVVKNKIVDLIKSILNEKEISENRWRIKEYG